MLEVLVAAALMAALLVALWRLIGIYTSLREKGDLHADRVSDVSVMTQQLEDDLRSLSSEGLRALPGDAETNPIEEIADAGIPAPSDELPQTVDRGSGTRVAEPDVWPPNDESYPDSVSDSGRQYPAPAPDDSDSTRQTLPRTTPQSPVVSSEQEAPGCLFGDETSLTLSHLDCEPSRRSVHTSGSQSSDAPDGYDPPGESGRLAQPSVLTDPVQQSTRLVRYWLVGALPLMVTDRSLAQTDNEHETLLPGDAEESLETDETKGLFREEVVCISTPSSLVHFGSSRRFGGSDDSVGGSGTYAAPMSTDRPDPIDRPDESEELSRRSFHLAQVEWAKFRYFDGSQWQSSWDSRSNGQLPVAIEMSLWLAQREANKGSGTTSEEPDVEWSELEVSHDMGPEYPQPPIAGDDSGGNTAEDAAVVSSQPSEDNPMERQPEVRQLVVLRIAEPARRSIPGLAPTPPRMPPRRAPQPAIPLPQ